MEAFNERRDSYHSDGGVALFLFFPLAMATLLVGIFMAFVLDFLFTRGYFYIIFMPLLASLPVAGAAIVAVKFGHCRSRLLAGCLGFLAGTVLYLGYYHVGLLHHIGFDLWYRLDLLPEYINWQVSVSTTTSTPGVPAPETVNSSTDIVMNWLLFVLEFLIVLCFCCIFSIMRAGYAYSSRNGNWFKRIKLNLPVGSAAILKPGLSIDTLRLLLQQPTASPQSGQGVAVVSIDYCEPLDGTDRDSLAEDFPVYFSIGDGAFPKSVIRQVELRPEEVALLSGRFPDLRVLSRGQVMEMPQTQIKTSSFSDGISIETLSGPHAGKVLTLRNTILMNVIGSLPIFVFLGSMALIAIPGIYVEKHWNEAHDAKFWFAIGGLVASLFLLIIFGYILIRHLGFLPGLYWKRLVRRELRERSDKIVDPEAPDAIFLQMVPRDNVGKPMLESASDLGFLRVDCQRRELLFEGDKERYRIALDRLSSCELEITANPQSPVILGDMVFLVPKIIQDDFFWEAPLAPYGPPTRTHKKTLEPFEIAIKALRADSHRQSEGSSTIPQNPVSSRFVSTESQS